MASIDMTNGATVSRFYSDGDGELMAVFQYTGDADDWAKTKVDDDHARGLETSLCRTCLYSGKSRMFLPPKTNN